MKKRSSKYVVFDAYYFFFILWIIRLFLLATQCEMLYNKYETACEDEVKHEGEHWDEQDRTSDVVSEGDEDDTCTYLTAGEHAHWKCKALLERAVAVEEHGG